MNELDEKAAPGAASTNADELTKLLEIELIQKRTEWQRTTARNKNLKSVSLLFLALVVMAGMAAFYFMFMRVQEGRQHRAAAEVQNR